MKEGADDFLAKPLSLQVLRCPMELIRLPLHPDWAA
jgi:FixJ family two-component response regulator